MAGRLVVKDPNCLAVTIIPWASGTRFSFDPLLGRRTGILNNTLDLERAVRLQGVFAEDGAAATLDATTEEDEYIESADGSVCVTTKNRNNEILTLRLNSCTGYIDALIALKGIRTNQTGNGRLTGPVPLYVHVCNACDGYSLVTDCAWILTNISKTFGNDDTAVEVKILLSQPRDNRLAIDAEEFTRIESAFTTTL